MNILNKPSPEWYKKIWSLDIQDMSWVEHTKDEINFIIDIMELSGTERILDLACGFGRHAIELTKRGFTVVGVDITPEFIKEARRISSLEKLNTEFICADLRDVSFKNEFDVVLNMSDGAIGYLENDEENTKIFDLIASSLRKDGKHFMNICNAEVDSSIRLYTISEIKKNFKSRQMVVKNTFGKFDKYIPESHKEMQLLVYSQKI
jgi:2-polyprenyl-3-methyl-5-hydroxy-6-metoxy-1,4-benzoquinol methylase